MKKLFLAFCALATTVACVNEETVRTVGRQAIDFSGAFVENATRSEDPSTTTESIQEFYVWAYINEVDGIVFDDERVYGGQGAWTYDEIQYWLPGNSYYFAAFAGDRTYVEGLPTTMEENGLGEITFTNNDGTNDILYAEYEATTPESITSMDKVNFQFAHLLSKVKFTFKNGFSNENNTIVVKNIQMAAPGVGTINLSEDEFKWYDQNGNVDLVFGDMNLGERLAIGDAKSSDVERLTIPAPATEAAPLVVTFTTELYNGDQKGAEAEKTVNISGIELLPGRAYNFVATLNYDNILNEELLPIEFECVVDEWIDALDPKDEEGKVDAVIENELKAAAQFGGVVTLSDNVVLTSPVVIKNDVTIDLNGFNISSASDVFEVAAGSLTIKGEGEVFAATDNGTPYCAVWAYGDAEVNIYGGTYKVGYPTGDYNDLIYAKENAVINIYGGKFYNSGKENAFVLNLKDGSAADINVYGGAYEKFNPANNNSEGANTNFVAEGLYSTEIDGWFYVSNSYLVLDAAGLQAALDADKTDICFAQDIVGDVTIEQKEGVNYVINGAGFKFDGTMTINGHHRFEGTETLVIKNVAFETATAKDFIWSNTDPVRYAHNITIEGCTFTAPDGVDAVGMRIRQAYNLAIKDCVMNGGHSLIQNTAVSYTLIENTTVEAGRGLNLLTSGNVDVVNCNITATKADGYGVRADAGYANVLNIKGSTINAYEPVVLRSAKSVYEFNLVNSTLTATGAYQIVVKGETPKMNGVEGLTIQK